jgi:predicted  nucleic acid-binding Zn-ribbon protein
MTHVCQTCGYKFKSKSEAEKAAISGCPECGGNQIDIASITTTVFYRRYE